MSFTDATPDPQPTYEALLFDGSLDHATEVMARIDAALTLGGLLLYGDMEGRREGEGPTEWRVRFKRVGDAEATLVAAGMWVTVSSFGAVRGLTDVEYQAGVR